VNQKDIEPRVREDTGFSWIVRKFLLYLSWLLAMFFIGLALSDFFY